MWLDKTVADQARQIEVQQKQIEALNAELVEQKRVVSSMGDVRTINEQLARQLKKEKSKVRSVTIMNTHLASQVDGAKKASDRRNHQHEPSEATFVSQGERSFGGDEHSSLGEHLDVRMDDTLAEDVAAVRSAGINPFSTSLRSELPQGRRGFTFEVPVAEFEATNIVDLTGNEPRLFSSLPDIVASTVSGSGSSSGGIYSK
ncbi:hypothetical protein LPJ81_003782, partial [Coemansia sp. IMI 209127]